MARHRAPAKPSTGWGRRYLAVAMVATSIAVPTVGYSITGHVDTKPAAVKAVAPPVAPETPTPSAKATPPLPTAARMVHLAARQIGVSGRPNRFTRWYATSSYGKTYAAKYGIATSGYLTANWCAEFLTWLAAHTGLTIPGDAYTVGMAEQFRAKGRFNRTPRVGDFAFYDWAGRKALSGIDHVGLVVAVKGSSLTVIEGNNGNAVRKVVRSTALVVGFGHPNYVRTP